MSYGVLKCAIVMLELHAYNFNKKGCYLCVPDHMCVSMYSHLLAETPRSVWILEMERETLHWVIKLLPPEQVRMFSFTRERKNFMSQ